MNFLRVLLLSLIFTVTSNAQTSQDYIVENDISKMQKTCETCTDNYRKYGNFACYKKQVIILKGVKGIKKLGSDIASIRKSDGLLQIPGNVKNAFSFGYNIYTMDPFDLHKRNGENGDESPIFLKNKYSERNLSAYHLERKGKQGLQIPNYLRYDNTFKAGKTFKKSVINSASEWSKDSEVSIEGNLDMPTYSFSANMSYAKKVTSMKSSKRIMLTRKEKTVNGTYYLTDHASFNEDFIEAVENLKDRTSNDSKFTDFFDEYGTHFAVYIEVGRKKIYTSTLDEKTVKKVLSKDKAADVSGEKKVIGYGGLSIKLAGRISTEELNTNSEYMKESTAKNIGPNKMNFTNPHVITVKLVPIYELFSAFSEFLGGENVSRQMQTITKKALKKYEIEIRAKNWNKPFINENIKPDNINNEFTAKDYRQVITRVKFADDKDDLSDTDWTVHMDLKEGCNYQNDWGKWHHCPDFYIGYSNKYPKDIRDLDKVLVDVKIKTGSDAFSSPDEWEDIIQNKNGLDKYSYDVNKGAGGGNTVVIHCLFLPWIHAKNMQIINRIGAYNYSHNKWDKHIGNIINKEKNSGEFNYSEKKIQNPDKNKFYHWKVNGNTNSGLGSRGDNIYLHIGIHQGH